MNLFYLREFDVFLYSHQFIELDGTIKLQLERLLYNDIRY